MDKRELEPSAPMILLVFSLVVVAARGMSVDKVMGLSPLLSPSATNSFSMNDNEKTNEGAMTFLRSQETKRKESDGKNRLGFPSLKLLRAPNVEPEAIFDLSDKLHPDIEKKEQQKTKHEEDDAAIESIRNAIVASGVVMP